MRNCETNGMIQWAFYPKSLQPPDLCQEVVGVFEAHSPSIDSAHHTLDSNSVLAYVKPDLLDLGFEVETGKTRAAKVTVPFYSD